MNSFSFSVPQNLIFGKNSLEKLPGLLKENGSRHVLIISGPHLNKMGVVDRIKELVGKTGIDADAYTQVEANPSVETVDKAAALYQECGADSIVAIGGGSPLDVAKAVGVLVKYGGSITEYDNHATNSRAPDILIL